MTDGNTLRIERIHHYRDTIRPYTVHVDGTRVGRVMDDKDQAFAIPPGQHSVRIRLMWISSPAIDVDLTPDTQTVLRCGPNGGIAQAWRLFFAPHTAIFLEPVDRTDTETENDHA